MNYLLQASLLWLRYYCPPNGTVLYFYQVRTSCRFWLQVILFLRINQTGTVHAYKHGFEAHSCNHCCGVKERLTYSECVCTRRYPVCPALQCFFTLSRKLHSKQKKSVTHKCIFISVINQLDAQHFCFTISLFHACTCFEHMCSSSGDQNCITQPLVSSHLV